MFHQRHLIPALVFILFLLLLLACSGPAPTPTRRAAAVSPNVPRATEPGAALLIIGAASELNFTVQELPAGWQVGGKGEADGGYEFNGVKLGIIPTVPEVLVISWVKAFPDIQTASTAYVAERQKMAETFRLDDPRIGDESFVFSGNVYQLVFRKTNVLARISMFGQYGGSLKETKQWAEKLSAKIDRVKRLGTPPPAVVSSPTPQSTPRPAATAPTPRPTTIQYAFPTQVTGPVPTPSPTLLPTATPLPSNVFVPAKSMSVGRVGHSAVRLSDGRVLVAGGRAGIGGCKVFSSAEIFDPSTESWAPAASMHAARSYHTMTLLYDGRILATGGQNGLEELASVEIYDPRSNTWQVIGSMSVNRAYHTAAMLPTGQVLIFGGYAYEGLRVNPVWRRDSAEIFDPTTGTFFPTGKLNQARVHHSATLLIDGRVLAVGGLEEGAYSTAEIFDPAKGTFSTTGGPVYGRRNTDLTLLLDGTVLVRGGYGDQSSRSAELYNPTSATFQLISQNLPARYMHLASFLGNGKVLITGGTSVSDSAELYDPETQSFTSIGRMNHPRVNHVGVELANGTVLIVGGKDDPHAGCNDLSAVEIYHP